jgi:TusA-related sulfurtransferase
MSRIDTRGRSCPEPVLLTKKGIDQNTKKVEVIVDNSTAEENVMKFLKNSGFQQITKASEGDDTVITAQK